MKNTTFSENFAIIALNAQDSLHASVAKTTAMGTIAVAGEGKRMYL